MYSQNNSQRNSVSSPSFSSRTQSPLNFNYPSSSLPSPAVHRGCMSAAAKRYKYLRRLLHFEQMDFQFAFSQMTYLFIQPQKVYRNFEYRKRTKYQFARDDPAFLVLLSIFLLVTSAGFGFLVLRTSFLQFILLLLYIVIVDCIFVGIIISTLVWFLCNKYLLKPGLTPEHCVEWGYCFDVHLNALVPLLAILHGVVILLYHAVISHPYTICMIFGNVLWLIALIYYVYITFLGYSTLPQLRSTRVFLYPLMLIGLVFIVSLISNFNASIALVNFYRFRVL